MTEELSIISSDQLTKTNGTEIEQLIEKTDIKSFCRFII